MNRSLLLAGLVAVLLPIGAFAQSTLLDQTPSPTIVYGELITTGASPMCSTQDGDN